MVAIVPESPEHIVLDGVSWNTYESLLRELEGRRRFRITYDQGRLEIMTVSFRHESGKTLLGRFVESLTLELYKALHVCILGPGGKYKEKDESQAFPFLPMADIERFLLETEAENHTALMRSFHKWVRATVAPKYRAWSGKTARSGKKGKGPMRR